MSSLILIVDDNYKNLQVLGSTLKEQKYKTAIATNGFEALDFVSKKKPDLILLDIMMPEIDGIKVCEELKQKNELKHIPVIFLTAKTDTQTIQQAFKVGGQDFITKPFKAVELLARVETHLELKKQRDIISDMNKYLEQQVEERTKELQNANEKLNKIDNTKSEFLNLISHELRTPLNAIKGFSYILKDAVSDKKYLEFIDEIDQAADKLVKLSDTSLLITSLKFDNFKKRNINVKLNEYLNSVILSFCSKNRIDKNKILKDFDCSDKTVNLESTLISNALSMVLDNAIKHSPKNEQVLFKASLDEKFVNIFIRDKGKGFSEKAFEQVFNFFTQKTIFSASGLGIGLATVKLIMDSVGGSVDIKNLPEKGAEVSLHFPANTTV